MSTPFQAARAAIDECHKRDPAYVSRNTASPSPADSKQKVDELTYADRMEHWACHLIDLCLSTPEFTSFSSTVSSSSDVDSVDYTSELLRLAARCQHLERFLTPRSSYPEGKAGYLKWRRDLYKIQADRAKQLLLNAGVEGSDWVHKWVSKTELNPGKDTGDMGTQLLEDAAVLVFLQEELEVFAGEHGDYKEEKFVDIIKKTWRKLSNLGKEEALKLTMPKGLEPIVMKAVAEVNGKEKAEQRQGSSTSNPESSKKKTSSSAPIITSLPRTLRPKTAAEAEAILASRAANPTDSDPVFGARLLTDPTAIFTHNAWDHVTPPPSHYAQIAETLARQAETKLSLEEAEEFHSKPAGYWNTFYSSHENRFFKDRKWLHLEFPELVQATLEGAGEKTVLEVGCGAGNTVLPLLEINKNPKLSIHACDYSSEAVSVVRSQPLYSDPPAGAYCLSSVWDLSSPTQLPEGLKEGSVDIVVLIFVFSALHPREWQQAVQNIRTLLKPGGMVLFRDYARYDLPQLRFKKRRMLQDNFYLRGDGTRVYFFQPEELLEIFNAEPQKTAEDGGEGEEEVKEVEEENRDYDFGTTQIAIDRRCIVNRKELKTMYRNWVQAKFQLLNKEG